VLSSHDKAMEGLVDHLDEEDDPDEDQEIDEIVEEELIDEEIVKVVGEQPEDLEVDEVEPGALDSRFDSGEEDESDPDYDPYRNH